MVHLSNYYSYLFWTFFPCCRMGYEGLWKKRTNELYDEGEATFYKMSRFTVVESNTYSLADLANKVKSCVLRKIKLKYLLHEEMHLSLFSTGIYFILLQSQNRETWLSKLLVFLGYTCINKKTSLLHPPFHEKYQIKKKDTLKSFMYVALRLGNEYQNFLYLIWSNCRKWMMVWIQHKRRLSRDTWIVRMWWCWSSSDVTLLDRSWPLETSMSTGARWSSLMSSVYR